MNACEWRLVTSGLVGGIIGLLVGVRGPWGRRFPPGSVGVNPTIERQKKLEALEEKQREAAAERNPSSLQPETMLQGQDVQPSPVTTSRNSLVMMEAIINRTCLAG